MQSSFLRTFITLIIYISFNNLLWSFNPIQFTLGNDTTLCGGSSLELSSGLTADTLSFVWSNGSTDPTITVTAAGTYTLTVTSENCIASDTIMVNFIPLPEVNFSVAPVCFGETSVFQNNSTFLPSADITWIFGDGTSSDNTESIVEHTYEQNGFDFNVTLIIDHGFGCEGQVSNNARVEMTPQVDFSIDNGCFGDTTILFNNTTGLQESVAFQIDTNGVSITPPDPFDTYEILFPTPNTYSIQLSATNSNGCSDTDGKTIEIFPLPFIDLGNDTVIMSGTSILLDGGNDSPDVTYLWGNNTTEPTLEIFNPGPYLLTITDINTGCAVSDTIFINFFDPTATSLLMGLANLKVFPNPTTDYFNFTFEATAVLPPMELSIVNLHGQTLYKEGIPTLSGNTFFKQFDVSYLTAGTYFILLDHFVVEQLIVRP